MQPWSSAGDANRAQRGAVSPRVALGNGPEVLSGRGDPNGVRRARMASLYVQEDGPALWQNTDGAFAWTQVGGGGAGMLMQTHVISRDQGALTGDVVVPVVSDCGQVPFGPFSTEALGVGGDAFSEGKGPFGIPFFVRVDEDNVGAHGLASGTNTLLNVQTSIGAGWDVTVNVTGPTEITLSFQKYGAGVDLRARMLIWGCPAVASALAARVFPKPRRIAGEVSKPKKIRSASKAGR